MTDFQHRLISGIFKMPMQRLFARITPFFDIFRQLKILAQIEFFAHAKAIDFARITPMLNIWCFFENRIPNRF